MDTPGLYYAWKIVDCFDRLYNFLNRVDQSLGPITGRSIEDAESSDLSIWRRDGK